MEDNIAPDGAFSVEGYSLTGDLLEDKLTLSIMNSRFAELHGRKQAKQVGKQTLIEYTDSYKECIADQKIISKEISENIQYNNPEYEKKFRFSTEVLGDAMIHIIDTCSEVADSISHVSAQHNIPEQKLIDAKHLRIFNQNKVIDIVEHNRGGILENLSEDRLYDRNRLAKSSTANQMLSNTYDMMKIYGELDSLRQEVMLLKMETKSIKDQVEYISDFLHITTEPKHMEAFKLKQKGMKHKQIATELGVSTKTVSRWLNRQ